MNWDQAIRSLFEDRTSTNLSRRFARRPREPSVEAPARSGEVLDVLYLAVPVAGHLGAGERADTGLEDISRLLSPAWCLNQRTCVHLVDHRRHDELDELGVTDLREIWLLFLGVLAALLLESARVGCHVQVLLVEVAS